MGILDALLEVTDHYRGITLRGLLEQAAQAGNSASYTFPTITSGVIDPTQRVTYLNVDATKAFTLAAPTYVGQTVLVIVITGTNTPVGTVTPAVTAPTSGATYATVTALGVVGDFCEFISDGVGWGRGRFGGVTFT